MRAILIAALLVGCTTDSDLTTEYTAETQPGDRLAADTYDEAGLVVSVVWNECPYPFTDDPDADPPCEQSVREAEFPGIESAWLCREDVANDVLDRRSALSEACAPHPFDVVGGVVYFEAWAGYAVALVHE